MLPFILLAGLLTGAPANAAPVPGSPDFDAQCMIVTGQVGARASGSDKSAADAVAMFYFGRVDAAVSGDALQQRLSVVARQLEGKDIAAIARECGRFMAERGLAMARLGQAMEAEEKARGK